MKKLFFILLISFSILAFDAYSDCIELEEHEGSGILTPTEQKFIDLEKTNDSIGLAFYGQSCEEAKMWCIYAPVDPNIKLNPDMHRLKNYIGAKGNPSCQTYKKFFIPSFIEGIHFELTHGIRLIKVENGQRKVILSSAQQRFLSTADDVSYDLHLKGKMILKFYTKLKCKDALCKENTPDYVGIYIVDTNDSSDYYFIRMKEKDTLITKENEELYVFSNDSCIKNKYITRVDFKTKKLVKIDVPNCGKWTVFNRFFGKEASIDTVSFEKPRGRIPLEKDDVPALEEQYAEFINQEEN